MANLGEQSHLNKAPASSSAAAVIKLGAAGELRVADMEEIAEGVIKANYGTQRLLEALAEKLPASNKIKDPQGLAAGLKILVQKHL